MPCPLFIPEEPLDTSGWDIAPRMPLGKAWAGLCSSDSSRPDSEALWKWCNVGYARGSCPRFPLAHLEDAVRFAKFGGKLHWIVEKDHSPLEFGEVSEATPEIIRRQAAAYSD